MISGPVPVLIHPHLAIHFATQIFTHDISKLGDEFVLKLRHPLALLPASDGTSTSIPQTLACPFHRQDHLVKEQFCLVLTHQFSLVMVLGQDATVSFEYGPEGSTSTRVKYSGECILTSYETSAGVGDVVSFTASFQISGAVTRGTW